MSYIFIYFTIGFVICFLIEFSTQHHNSIYEEEEVTKFDWFDRLFNIILWPITVMLFIKNLKDLFR